MTDTYRQKDKIMCPTCGKISEVEYDENHAPTMMCEAELNPKEKMFALIGKIAMGLVLSAALYYAAIFSFYDPIYDTGFEAGRASAVRDCGGNGHINQCIMPDGGR